MPEQRLQRLGKQRRWHRHRRLSDRYRHRRRDRGGRFLRGGGKGGPDLDHRGQRLARVEHAGLPRLRDPFGERAERDAQFGREFPHGLHRRGEVAFEADELEVGGVALVSHDRIIREGVVGVKEGNHLWIPDYCIKNVLVRCIRTSMAIEMKHPLNFETP